MGSVLPFEEKPHLSDTQLEVLRRRLCDASERMSDEQVLCLADALHDTLRTRRGLRTRVHDRLEHRLCSGEGAHFPF